MSAPSCGSSKSRERNGILTRLYGGDGSWVGSSESAKRSRKTVSSGKTGRGTRESCKTDVVLSTTNACWPDDHLRPVFSILRSRQSRPPSSAKEEPPRPIQGDIAGLFHLCDYVFALQLAAASRVVLQIARRPPVNGWSREGGGPPAGHQGSHLGVIASLEKAGRQGRRGSQHHLAGVRVALAKISRHRDRVAAQKKSKGTKGMLSMGIDISLGNTILRVSKCVPKVQLSRRSRPGPALGRLAIAFQKRPISSSYYRIPLTLPLRSLPLLRAWWP